MDINNFEQFFNSKSGKRKFNVRLSRAINGNVKDFRELAFLKHNCEFLYNYLSNVFGEEYSEFIIENILNETYNISNPEVFTLKNCSYIEEDFCLDKISKNSNNNFPNLITELEYVIINELRNGKTLLLVDLLIILSVYYNKFLGSKKVSHATFEKSRDVPLYGKVLMKNFLKVLSLKDKGFSNITVGILDEVTFNKLISSRDYRFMMNKFGRDGEIEVVVPTYKNYLSFLDVFFECYNTMKSAELPDLVGYVCIDGDITETIVKGLESKLALPLDTLRWYFRNINITGIDDLNSDKTRDCIRRILNRVKLKSETDNIINYLFNLVETHSKDDEERINFLELPVYKTITEHKVKVNKTTVLYNRYNIDDLFIPKRSEIIIDYNKIKDDELTVDEELEKLIKYFINAQTINQARLSILNNVTFDNSRCNVTIKSVPENLTDFIRVKLQEQIVFLRSTYNVKFTFEIVN